MNIFRKKINIEDNSCTDNCSLTNYKYEYNYKCYHNCLSGTYNNDYKCEDCHPDCKECEGSYTLNNTNCISCSSPNKVLKFGNCINQDECLRSIYFNDSIQQYICKCDLEQCFTCSLLCFLQAQRVSLAWPDCRCETLTNRRTVSAGCLRPLHGS